MVERPAEALRRLAPDTVQLQVIVGSLLGDGRIVGAPGRRRLVVAHSRAAYARWKYERLGALAAAPPLERDGLMHVETIAHPLFDDLVWLARGQLLALTAPLGLAVWLSDLGRIELRLDSFLPRQQSALWAA